MTAVNTSSGTSNIDKPSYRGSETEDLLSSRHPRRGAKNSAAAFQSKDGNFTVGAVSAEFVDSMTLGKIAVSATALEGQMQKSAGPAAINAKVTVGTVNAHASTEFNKSTQNNTLAVSVSAGAEAIAFETTVGMDLTLSAKPMNNLWRAVYNNVVDPAIDFITQDDMPELPFALVSVDQSISISGKVSSGWGSAAKLGAALNIDDDGYSLSAMAKVTPFLIGPTTGGELSISVK